MAAKAPDPPLRAGADRTLRHGRGRSQPNRSILWLIFPMAFAVRLVYDAGRQLVPDEAFYWVLSRHLAGGYLDHPPGVAVAIRLGTFIFGFNELGVRAFMSVMGFGAVLILMALCRRMLKDDRAVIWLGIIWICSPLMAALSTLATPDTPSVFFSVCAVALAILATEEPPNPAASAPLRPSSLLYWTAFGLATGLALDSKYTSILPALAVAAALLTTTQGRRQLLTPGPWIAIIVAIAAFWPVIQWNAHHDWASFKFQLHHGLDAEEERSHLKGFAEFVLGQFGFWTPLLMIVGLTVTIKSWLIYRRLNLSMRILLWSATVPLVFFGVSAFKSGAGEANWPAFAYFPMSILIVEDLHQNWKRVGVTWVRFGIIIALVITLVMQSPELISKVAGPKYFPHKLDEFFGWKELAQRVDLSRGYDELIVADRHQLAGELAFYMRGQPDVWCYPVHLKSGELRSRPTSFDYMPDRPDLSKVEDLVYVGGGGDAREFCKAYGFAPNDYGTWAKKLHSDGLRERSIIACSRKLIINVPLLPTTRDISPTTHAAIEQRHNRVLRRIPDTQPADTKPSP
jgi:hypothetical protein